ncbi:hypothetical protein [Pantoea agglomerans]|uniref:hypothetical protein n=1 Tax=Enterobacter agglomerans TaxID=549 RepID=UPI001F5BEFB1|nr:hypothetical protein [Pantoea agglomerans]
MFGILDDTKAADDALDALVNDPAVTEIRAFSDLLFRRRHHFQRSGITIDFQSFHLSTSNIEPASVNDPFSAVLFFKGKPDPEIMEVVLTAPLQEQTDTFPVDDSNHFRIGDWYAVQSNVTGGSAARELQKMVQVTAIIDNTHIQVSYYNGWKLDAGRVISWQRVEPVRDITIRSMRFTGAGSDQVTGSHPLAFEYAVRANVTGIHATGSFWPVIMRRWNTHYITEQCSLLNPPDTSFGGAGYLTQQIYCLYGDVRDCHTSNARHLNDFTASAYCRVENCHADGQSAEKGPFVTHGQYEHDLTYAGNSGLMTFANSGATWGSSARRIHVSKHICPWFVARAGVSDLTLDDVVVVASVTNPGSGMLWVNADGLRMTGCCSNGVLRITQSSSRSSRQNLIQQCSFTLPDDASTLVDNSVKVPVTFIDTTFRGINGHTVAGDTLIFSRCVFYGGNSITPTKISAPKLSLHASRFFECNVVVGKPAGHNRTEIFSLWAENSRLDFSPFADSLHSTLMFCQNQLRDSVLLNQPEMRAGVIVAQNMILSSE